MSQLSECDLALLSSLMYCDEVVKQPEGVNLKIVVSELLKKSDDELWRTGLCGDFGHLKSTESEVAAGARFREVLIEIQNSSSLMNLKITNPHPNNGTKAGVTAACFVDTRDNTATVAFRGTDGSYKAWYDNFEGAGTTTETPMQKEVRDYINGLEYNNISVTGHSKGGNLAAFATIVCPNVARCISFDGQGFSEAFHKRYKDLIDVNGSKIETIAAHNDFVNILMFTIGKTIYVQNGGTGAEAHYISNLIFDNLFDEKGNFSSLTEQDSAIKILKAGVDTLLVLLPAPLEEWFTDTFGPLAAILMGKNNVTGDDILHMIGNLLLGISVAILAPALLEALIIVVVAVVLATVAVLVVNFTIDLIVKILNTLVDMIVDISKKIGLWAKEFANNIKNIVAKFCNSLINWYNNNLNAGYMYATANPFIQVDTYKLRTYSERISATNRRVINLDLRIKNLYWRLSNNEDWFSFASKLYNLAQADRLTGYSPRLTACAAYLNGTATDFENAERNILNNAVRIT